MNIKIATEFSESPGPRYPKEGEFSGEDFRKKHLLPKIQEAINKKVKLNVDLDDTSGFGTSFLEESFGGLIRIDKLKYEDIMNTLEFTSEDDPEYIEEIKSYLSDADKYENQKK